MKQGICMRLFDLHADTLSVCYDKGMRLRRNTCHIDLERGNCYDRWIQVFAVWLPDTLKQPETAQKCWSILNFAEEELRRNNDLIQKVVHPADCEKVRSGAIFSIENGGAVFGDLHKLLDAASHGVKLITLTWNGSNLWGNGCLSGIKNGLTPLGKEAVKQMPKYGIFPDVSHLNEAGFWDTVELAKGPVMATHSLSAAVHSHPRNLTDAQFDALRQSGGLVGLNLCAEHLGEQNFWRFERHLCHFWERGGERTVALGMDLDGTNLPEDWQGIAVAEKLWDYLCRKNYNETLLSRLFFENGYDFFKQT